MKKVKHSPSVNPAHEFTTVLPLSPWPLTRNDPVPDQEDTKP